jgi:hypothetical protein
MAKLSQGGQTATISKEKKIYDVKFGYEGAQDRTINLFINEDSLTYLTLSEALALKDELDQAISKAVNRKPKNDE